MPDHLTALIPARAGSTRIPNKNSRLLAGHPLIAYTIVAAKTSLLFGGGIVVCSDDEEILRYAHMTHNVETYKRDASSSAEPDIAWMTRWLRTSSKSLSPDAVFAILRPTSPFRTADSIRQAYQAFEREQPADSLRFIRKVHEHPGKMWVQDPLNPWLVHPFMPNPAQPVPWHSLPTQSIPFEPYVQTGGCELMWKSTIERTGTIGGRKIIGFVVELPIALDLNTLADWQYAEYLVAMGVPLPCI